MKNILLLAQIIISTLLVIIIIMQSKGSGLSTVFGGAGGFYRSRRGVEKLFVYLTISLAFVFLVISIVQVVL